MRQQTPRTFEPNKLPQQRTTREFNPFLYACVGVRGGAGWEERGSIQRIKEIFPPRYLTSEQQSAPELGSQEL